MTLSERCVNKPVTTLLVFILMVGMGLYCMTDMPVDMYPDMDLPYMLVYTSNENAGPEEIEQNITQYLESALSSVSGLDTMTSYSQTGASIVIMEYDYGTNLDTASVEIREKIDMVRSYMPDDADSPITMKLDPSMMPIMQIALRGPLTPEELRTIAEDTIESRFEQLDGVASATVIGGREESINVDIPRDRLEAYGLTISTVAQMIGTQNIQSSGGTITAGDKKYTIKTSGKYQSIDDLKNTVITYKPDSLDGSRVVTITLRDIADVYEGYKDESTLAYLDGEACVMFYIQKQTGKNTVAAAKNVRAAMEKLKSELPNGVTLTETSNEVDIIEQTIGEVVSSVVQGALLAIAILFIFLRSLKSTFIIGLAIPISVFVCLMLMYLRGMTINMVSLAGLLLGIGMLVDNSIVVLENIYSYRQRDAKPKVAAILGSQEMVASITSSTLTSVCIFLPMIMFKAKLGIMGQMFDALAYTIIFSLLCSLVVAVCLVPVLCSSYLRIDKIVDEKREGIGYSLNNAFNRFFLWLDNAYATGVSTVLNHRLIFIVVLVALFFLSIFAVKFVGFIYMPESASNSVGIEIELPQGTTLDATEDTLRSLEEIGKQELVGVKFTSMTVGGTSAISAGSETNEGAITWTLYKPSERQKGWDNEATAKRKLRKYFNSFPGATLTFSTSMNSASSNEMSVDIRCDDLDLLRETALQVEDLLITKGNHLVTEVTSEAEEGLPQAEIVVDRDRMYEMGLTIYSVGNEISGAINGKTASRYTRKGDDIDVIVRFAEKDRAKLSDLDQISVVNSSGVRVPLSSFAHYEETLSPVTIYRENQTRILHVTTKPMEGVSLDVVQSGLLKLINENIPKDDAVTISISGDYEDMVEAVGNFALIIIVAAALVFVVMASQFESLVDPFIVIMTIPLSFIGVVAIYAICGQQLSIMTVMGMLVLVGTIVNNGIVLVDYTNLLRKRGYELREACVEAARNRLRPILMSTLTTVISLAPMAFFPGEGAQAMQPISLTVFGGMTFGSLMTLFLMPTIYFIINSRRIKTAAKRAAKKEAQQRRKLAAMRGESYVKESVVKKAKGAQVEDKSNKSSVQQNGEHKVKKAAQPQEEERPKSKTASSADVSKSKKAKDAEDTPKSKKADSTDDKPKKSNGNGKSNGKAQQEKALVVVKQKKADQEDSGEAKERKVKVKPEDEKPPKGTKSAKSKKELVLVEDDDEGEVEQKPRKAKQLRAVEPEPEPEEDDELYEEDIGQADDPPSEEYAADEGSADDEIEGDEIEDDAIYEEDADGEADSEGDTYEDEEPYMDEEDGDTDEEDSYEEGDPGEDESDEEDTDEDDDPENEETTEYEDDADEDDEESEEGDEDSTVDEDDAEYEGEDEDALDEDEDADDKPKKGKKDKKGKKAKDKKGKKAKGE